MQLKHTILAIIVIYLFFSFRVIQAQDRAAVSLHIKDTPLTQVFSIIEKQTGYKFAYSSDLISAKEKVTLNVSNIPLRKLLTYLFYERMISYTVIGNQIVLERAPIPSKITISGYIKDSVTSEALANATIYLPMPKQSTSTNDYGFYSITTNQYERLAMVIVHKGHKRKYIHVDGIKSEVLNLYMSNNISSLRPLSYNKDSIDPVLLAPIPKISTNYLVEDSLDLALEDSTWMNDDLLQSVSSVNGNGDIINSIQMMPGVIAGIDATNGYYVRGGNKDQNLIQLDEATLYNPSHFFGLVSAFNSSTINSATLIKDGFYATYGDNLSSVLDITMKEGNPLRTGGEIQAGSTTSGITLYGPIVSQKSSYLFSARRSVMDLWLQPIQQHNNYNDYYFYDINAKVNYRISQNDRIYLSFYKGRDKSEYTSDSSGKAPIGYGIEYGNQTLTLRWNHLYNQRLFANTSFIYNSYSQSIAAEQKPYFAELYSGIRDIECKSDLNYYPNPNHKISAGISLLYQTLTPASLSYTEIAPGPKPSVSPSELPQKHSYRGALYVGDELKIGSKLQVYIGGRLPLLYTNSENYTHFEPRLSALYNITSSSGVKLSYTHMHQYLHLVQSYNASFPAEIWIGSSDVVKPESSWQSTIGLFKNLNNNTFQISLDVFYKQMDNQLLFGGGEQPTITSNIQDMLVFGESKSSGVELSLRKMKGKLKGWIAYTFSSATQQFDSLNLGKSFPFANDRQHSLYVTASYNINPHWELSSNLVITSGRAFTFDSETTVTPGQGSGLYKKDKKNKKPKTQIVQNNYMLDPYNRLDISISYKNKKQLATRTLESEWIFSVYNVYARPNTIFAYRTFDPATLKPMVQQVSFISVIPSITYRLSF